MGVDAAAARASVVCRDGATHKEGAWIAGLCDDDSFVGISRDSAVHKDSARLLQMDASGVTHVLDNVTAGNLRRAPPYQAVQSRDR